MDEKNYPRDGKVFRRDSARAIILQEGKVLLIHSKKYDYYKFPGGGIEAGEDPVQALCREVREETGYEVQQSTIREFGCVPRRQRDDMNEQGVFAQDNYYYFCEIMDQKQADRKLDDYEREEGFTPVWMEPFAASQHNRYCDASREGLDARMVRREAKVLDLVDLEIRKLERQTRQRNTLEALGHPEYFAMLEFVRQQLGEEGTEYSGSGKIEIAYSRYDHTKRVLAWALRLYQASERKEEIRFDELMIATIFHDVGRRRAEELHVSHAQAGIPITKEYLTGMGYAADKVEYICSLVAQHSDKYRMKKEVLDRGLLMLMEADLLDDMGAQGIVMDCMITESRNPNARFEDCLDHITRYTLRQQEEDNPMVSPEGIAFWNEKTKLTQEFVQALRQDLA
jgi:8-oxo-dGTP pyrophosphatase MutT (NUDIX family)/HD superfamily phosphodiesterase